jgi:hypothetical protein
VVKLMVCTSYGEGVNLYEEISGLSGLSKTTGWMQTQARGEQLHQHQEEQAEQAWVLPKRQMVLPGIVLEKVNKGIASDGVFVNIIGEGWKEVKVGCVFEYATLEFLSAEYEDRVKSTAQSYVACLGEPLPFGKVLSAEAEQRGYDKAVNQVKLGDGAKWIWNLNSQCFPTGTEIVDWYHAVEHLSRASELCFSKESEQKAWFKEVKEDLWQGQGEKVIAKMKDLLVSNASQKSSLETEIGYFEHNVRRMRYQEFREEGYPIGSGIIESGCKQVVSQRLKGSGMRWSRAGAEHILALRTEFLSNRWLQAWQFTRPA